MLQVDSSNMVYSMSSRNSFVSDLLVQLLFNQHSAI